MAKMTGRQWTLYSWLCEMASKMEEGFYGTDDGVDLDVVEGDVREFLEDVESGEYDG